jgi:hypothetical protein
MSKNTDLTFAQRIIAVIAYVGVFVLLTRHFSGDFGFLFDSQNVYNQLFVSVALLLIFGSYIAEPFFTKPTDVLVNSAGIFLFLLSINNPQDFIGYELLKYSTVALLGISLLVILISQMFKRNKWLEAVVDILVKIGQSKVSYSVIYIASLVSYFSDKPFEFSIFFTFWVIFISGFAIENSIIYISKLYHYVVGADKNSLFVGEAIGYENPFVFKVEIDLQKTKVHVTRGDLVRITLKGESDVFGVVVDQKILLNKKWLTVYLLREKSDFIRAPWSGLFRYGSLLTNSYKVHKADIKILSEELQKTINENSLYKNRNNFIGYVEQGSDINKINFYILPDNTEVNIVEGTIVSTKINNKDVLFQVVDGNTREVGLEHHDKHSFISVTARKLGEYDTSKKEIISVRWLPEMYSPVFLLNSGDCRSEGYEKTIGLLPNTSYPIEIKDYDALTTHNTAILGILGIGKSCLTFELIKKAVENSSTKIICIDITNEYEKELKDYVEESIIDKDEIGNDFLNDLKTTSAKTGSEKNPTEWGNKKHYETKIQERITTFYNDTKKRILILNPDWHAVTETNQKFNITHSDDLSVAQKTRIISERTFVVAKSTWDAVDKKDKTKLKARFLLVFEEAHSLIPEWNSAANDGDQSAANGTAKVILQGRKYGLGSFVVTQRTANISKSILNQCNTIFALRVFDDTGKQFLENYIGSEYANTLPALEERHAISMGKALKLKQPVIIRLNERDEIIIKNGQTKNLTSKKK